MTPASPALNTSALDQLALTEKAAVTALLATLKSQGLADGQALLDYSTRWAPIATRWGEQLAAATQSGDSAQVATLEDNLRSIADGAAEEIADAAILAQGTTEQGVQTAVTVALTRLARFAFAMLTVA